MGIDVIYKFNKASNTYYVNASALIKVYNDQIDKRKEKNEKNDEDSDDSETGDKKKEYKGFSRNKSTTKYIKIVQQELMGISL